VFVYKVLRKVQKI